MPIPESIQILIDLFLRFEKGEKEALTDLQHQKLDDWILEDEENMKAFEKEVERLRGR